MKKIYLFLFVVLGLHLVFLINLQFTAWPEIFSYPYLRNHGFLIYKDMIHPYPPILTMALSWLYSLFGYSTLGLKIFTWGLIIVNDFLIFLITQKLTKNKTASIAAVLIYVWTQPFLEGNMLWFDLAVVPPILAGIFFGFSYLENKSYKNIIATSAFFTVAALIKQTTLIFPFIFFIILLQQKISFKKLLSFFVTPLFLIIPLLVRLMDEGALNDFWNWVVYYPFQYWTKFPGYVRMEVNLQQIGVLMLIFSPLILVFVTKKFFNRNNIILILFFAVSLITVYPRFSFFHLQTSIALGAILITTILSNFKKNNILLILILIAWSIFIQKPILARDWRKEDRFAGEADFKFAEIIKQNTSKEDKIYLLGPHSGLYIYSERLPSKRWGDNFGWYFEIPGVQEEFLDRWKDDPPTFVFWQKAQNGNWFDLGVYQPKLIVEHIKSNYNDEGEVSPGINLWRRK